MRLAALLCILSTSALAQPAALTVTPTHPTPGLQLNWTGTTGSVGINRWTDANPAPVQIATTTGLTYTDSTAVANTIYYYRVSQGVQASNTFPGVVSDLTKSFNCPPMIPVDPSLLGVDRTVSFQSANGTQVTYTIAAPNAALAGGNIVNVAPCNGAGGCSDYTNINAATTAVAAGGTVQLSAGDYHLTNPAWSSGFNFNINMNCHDCILAGAPVASGAEPQTRVFFGQGTQIGNVSGLNTTNSRLLIRNITFDWDFLTAIPGIVTNLDASHQKFTVTNGPYYVPDPANPPVIWVMSGYDLVNRVYIQQAGSRIGGVAGAGPQSTPQFNINFGVDGLYYYTVNGLNLPDGTSVVMFVKTRNIINVGTDTTDASFENVRVYGGGGAGIIQGPHDIGLRMSNFVIDRKPDALLASGEQPRLVSLFGDNDSNATKGNILIENSQFGFIDDDTYYMRGSTFQLQTLTATNGFTMTSTAILINHASGPNEFIIFQDPVTYQQLGPPVQVTWTHVGNTWTFSFPAVPQLTPYIGQPSVNLPVVGQPLWSAPNAFISNICSHDNHGRVGFLNNNGVLQNSVLANGFYGPVVAVNDNALRDFGVITALFTGSISGTTLTTSSGNPAIGQFISGAGIDPNTQVLSGSAPTWTLSVDNGIIGSEAMTSRGGPTNNDGAGAQNIIWRNNKIIGTNYGDTDIQTIWLPTVKTNGYRQTGWGSAAMQMNASGTTGFYAPGNTLANFQIYGNFISNTNGLCILVTSGNNVGVVNNTCVDANQIAYEPTFTTTLCSGHSCCGGFSQGWQAVGANQPWCLAKVPAQGAIMITSSRNVDTTSTPNVFLGTSLGLFVDTPTVTKDNIVGFIR
jgi:hypothetical protein